MALLQRIRIFCILLTLILGCAGVFAQAQTGEPPRPDTLPAQFVAPVQRVFQVYGGISSLYLDKVKVVDVNGDTVEVDSVRPRTQTASYAESTKTPGDTIFMYATLGLTAIDRYQLLTDTTDAPFSGRDPNGEIVSGYRYLGFWFRMDIVSTVPDDDNPVKTGPTVFVWPNPFQEVVRLRIPRLNYEDVEAFAYSLDGRLLTQLTQESADDEGFTFFWDGTASDGTQVASGTYIVRLLASIPGSNQRLGYSAKIMRSR